MTTFEVKELYVDINGMRRMVLETYDPISKYDYREILENRRVNVIPTTDEIRIPTTSLRFGNPCDFHFLKSYSPYFGLDEVSHRIRKVIFNKPATIILWEDGDKTVVKCSKDDIYDPEIGFIMAVIKHDRPDFKKLFKKYYKEDNND